MNGQVISMRVGEKASLRLESDEQMFCKYSLYYVD